MGWDEISNSEFTFGGGGGEREMAFFYVKLRIPLTDKDRDFGLMKSSSQFLPLENGLGHFTWFKELHLCVHYCR